MTIHVVKRTTVGGLFDEKDRLKIPPYQRPYSWRSETALQLLDDIRDATQQQSDLPYVLGAVILHNDSGQLNVVDGQQRLLTLRIILDLLEPDPKEKPCGYQATSTGKDTPPIMRVYMALRQKIGCPDENAQTAANRALVTFIKHKCELIRIETDDIDEAFRVFDSQNYRGKPLAPHDLLKAYHLREMRDETPAMTAALVEAWESVGDAELDRLFSIYLYRIARWSRGERAPKFTPQDIGLFKGLSPGKDKTPHARYHTAAQAAMPLLTLLDSIVSNEKSRAIGHARFQLDAPLVAGRLFFERVTFMLAELKRLARDAFKEHEKYEKFSFYQIAETDGTLGEIPSRSRYRYVTELYLAAALYYTNKFGEENFEHVRDLLFAWGYVLRTSLLRVQYQSVDNLASGKSSDESAFKRIRNAASARELHDLSISISRRKENPKHEKDLLDLLKDKGFAINESA